MVESSFRFLDYEITKLDFKINNSFNREGEEVEIDVKFGSISKKEENGVIILAIGIHVFKNSVEKNYPFELEFTTYGYFHHENINEEELESFIKYNATAILFPYIRASVSNFTSLVGQQTLILPTYNIHRLLENENIYSYKTFDEINN